MQIVKETGLSWPTVNKAIKLYKDAGLEAINPKIIASYNECRTIRETAKNTGLSLSDVRKAIKLHEDGGMDVLRPKMGRTTGSGRILTPKQEDEIKNILYTLQPKDVGIICLDGAYISATLMDVLENRFVDDVDSGILPAKAYATWSNKLDRDYPQTLWCRDSVKELIKQKSSIELSSRGIDKYLLRWGFPKAKQNQRPIVRCSKEIQLWLKDNPPDNERSKVYWLYRERLQTETNRSMISAIDNHRRVLWSVIEGNFTQQKQVDFLLALALQSRQYITVVRSHHKHYTNLQDGNSLRQEKITVCPPLLECERIKMEKEEYRAYEVWKEIRQEIKQEWFDITGDILKKRIRAGDKEAILSLEDLLTLEQQILGKYRSGGT